MVPLIGTAGAKLASAIAGAPSSARARIELQRPQRLRRFVPELRASRWRMAVGRFCTVFAASSDPAIDPKINRRNNATENR